MPRVWLSLGSNLERERNLRAAVAALRRAYGPLILSPVYESQAVGFDGDPFLNLVVGLDTEQPPERLVKELHAIEDAHGRVRGQARFGPRTLDIDLLLYGDLVRTDGGIRVPRDEITRYAFILRPLSEVAGAQRHPVAGKTFRELWYAFDAAGQPLRPVELDTENKNQ
jgi:2-amino-4-hydroxy-6-hydroxymethyldihydropteridine diphosphokinase